MNNYKIPTIEEIYNECYRDKFFELKGFYPRPMKNFSSLTDSKKELLLRFQNLIKKNFDLIDWKLYIKACTIYLKYNFDLSGLGSLKYNKIYRTYINYNNIDISPKEIEEQIKSSLQFIKSYSKDSEMTVKEYFYNRNDIIPIILKHIYSGSVSAYFYACFESSLSFRIFSDIQDDVFYELFNCSRNEFLENNLCNKRERILRNEKLRNIINILNNKFKDII